MYAGCTVWESASKAVDPRSEFIIHPAPNKGLELTASSVHSCLAPASSSSSGLALDAIEHRPRKARRFGKEIGP